MGKDEKKKKEDKQYYEGRLVRTGKNGGKYIIANGNKKYINVMCFG
jgi:hypothetical protein